MASTLSKTSRSSTLKNWNTNPGEVVTLDMVARLAGVSPSTVSRILNGTAVVHAEKTKAVNDAIVKLGFTPNPMARGLAGGRSLSIGVITQAIDSPYYGITMRGIEDELNPSGYSSLYVSGHWNTKTESSCVDMLLSRRVDGIIVLTGRIPDTVLKSCAKKIPVVVTGRSLKASRLLSLTFDSIEGGRLATQHLIELGHRDIACITGNMKHPDAIDRLQGYQQALASACISNDPALVVTGDFTEESGLKAVKKLLSSGRTFTAIFASNDQMALGAALGLHQHGLKVPKDVSLVGFDDLPAATYTLPPLTTIHVSAYELGRLAGSSMLDLIDNRVPVGELPSPKLIQRESSAFLKSL
ncbi:MAG: LacI family transcriptional regulator [Rhodoferax sp.]|nr:LacI family transcriptional regulator [Rhodoferax sp.]